MATAVPGRRKINLYLRIGPLQSLPLFQREGRERFSKTILMIYNVVIVVFFTLSVSEVFSLFGVFKSVIYLTLSFNRTRPVVVQGMRVLSTTSCGCLMGMVCLSLGSQIPSTYSAMCGIQREAG